MTVDTAANSATPLPGGKLLKAPRNASFELLRVIAMLYIVAIHFCTFGGWTGVTGGANVFFIDLTRALFTPSVNIFVLISAYFLCTSEDFKIRWKKLAAVWLPVYFYSIILYTVFTATGVYAFKVETLITTLFPILMGKYWFATAYFIMMLASPFLNVLINKMNRAQFTALCIGIVLFASLQDFGVLKEFPLSAGYNGIWFCLLYFLAAYVRKYDIKLNALVWTIGLVLFIGATMLCTFVWKGAHYTSVVGIYMSLFLLLTAKKFAIRSRAVSRTICAVSKLTFGIYLIHMSPEFCGFMYESIFHSSKFIPSKYAFLIYVGFVLATFTACAIAEFVRQLCFKGINAIIHRAFHDKLSRMQNAVNKFFEKLNARINGLGKSSETEAIAAGINSDSEVYNQIGTESETADTADSEQS